MSLNEKMILKQWRTLISRISQATRGLVSIDGVEYFIPFFDATTSVSSTPRAMMNLAMTIPVVTVLHLQEAHVSSISFRTFFRGPNSWHVLDRYDTSNLTTPQSLGWERVHSSCGPWFQYCSSPNTWSSSRRLMCDAIDPKEEKFRRISSVFYHTLWNGQFSNINLSNMSLCQSQVLERKEESVKGEEVSLKVKVTFTKSSKRHWDVSV